MRKTLLMMGGAAVAMGLGAPAAYADVTCEPGFCSENSNPGVGIDTATFTVTPEIAGPDYVGPISAFIGNNLSTGTIANPVNFTDRFVFELFQTGLGGGTVSTSTTTLASLTKSTNVDFTSVLINGAPVLITKIAGGIVEFASAFDVPLGTGQNVITVNGVARGAGSYAGTINFTPVVAAVPEMATWGMMILGFVGMGAAMRRRRNTTVTFGNNRAFA